MMDSISNLGLDHRRLPDEREWPEVLKLIDRKLREKELEYRWLEEKLELSYREMDEQLRSHRENARAATETLLKIFPDLIFLLDEEGRILDLFNPEQLAPHFQVEREEVIGSLIDELFPGTMGETLRRLLERARRGEVSIRENASPLRSAKGGIVHLDIRVHPVPRMSGGRTATIVTLRNLQVRGAFPDSITQRVFDQAREGMAVMALSGELLYTNRAFERIFASLPERRFGALARYLPAETFRSIRESIMKQKAYSGEVLVHRPDGIQVPVWLSLETIRDSSGRDLCRYMLLSDIADLQHSEVALQYSATHDPLTGLPNRQGLLDHLHIVLKRMSRNHSRGAIFFIDLDNFKEINDSMGHLVGDKVLVEIGNRVKSVVRENDIFGRLGGDEFLLIVEEISSPDMLMRIAQKVIEVINRPIRINGMNYQVGASVGVTIFPKDGKEREELLRYADMAMYRAKEEGKNRYHFYSSQIDQTVKRHFHIEKALGSALENDGFYLLFQPQIDLATDMIVGFEALLRIDSLRDDGRALTPSEFIPIAEESDLILRIGRWVLTHCCQVLYSWKNMVPQLPFLQISINLSRRQLIDEGWVEFVAETLRRYRIDPVQIEFEITETAFMHSGEHGYRILRKLQELGCRLAIDDFGTGYSSLSSLKEFTVDRLKIDRSFITEIVGNPTDRAIVKASIAMAQALGLKTIAEGVETSEQKNIVKLLGCDEMQGYLHSEPVNESHALQMLSLQWNEERRGTRQRPSMREKRGIDETGITLL